MRRGVVAELVLRLVRVRADHGNPADGLRVERQHAALVLEERHGLARQLQRHCAVGRAADHVLRPPVLLGALFGVNVRMLKEPGLEPAAQHAAERNVDVLLRDQAPLDGLHQPVQVVLRLPAAQVVSGLHRQGRRLAEIPRKTLPAQGADRPGIRDERPLVAELLAHEPVDKIAAQERGDAVNQVVARHELRATALDRVLERTHVDVE